MGLRDFIRDYGMILQSPIEPFHADEALKKFIGSCVRNYGVKTFVETGTFRGDSLLWFASMFPGVRCLSVESNKNFWRYSRIRAWRMRNVSIVHGDARQFLRTTIDGILDETPLFWLDAHWSSDWPILEELRTIQHRSPTAIILIDDFEVPGRPRFGFDVYDGNTLNREYIGEALMRPCEVWLPDYPAPPEARGVCALFFGVKGSGEPLFKRSG